MDDSGGQQPYQRVDSLIWNATELAQGKCIKIKGFPKDHKVHLFRVTVSTHRTDWIVTNDRTQDSTAATQEACGYRWKIEQLHREGKQVTGLERCQCRKARIQRNHIGCALLVWVRLKDLVPLRRSSYTSLSRQRFPRISPFKRFSQGFVEVIDEVEQPLA